MRIVTFVFCFFIICCSVAQDTWQRVYEGIGIDVPSAFERLSSSDLCIVGTTSSTGVGLSDGLIFRTSANGDVVWTRTLGSSNADSFSDVIVHADKIAVVGTTLSTNQAAYDILVAIYDFDGNLLNHEKYDLGTWEFGKKIIAAPSGGWYVVSEKHYTSSLGIQACVFHIDEALDVVWSQEYGVESVDRINDLVLDDNSDLVFAGCTTTSQGDLDEWTGRISPLDGEVLAQYSSGTLEDDELKAMLILANGDLVFAGYSNYPEGGGKDFLMKRTTATFDLIWNRFQGGPEPDELNAVLQREDGDLVFCGSSLTTLGSGGYEIFSFSVSSGNSFRFIQPYGGSQDEYGFAVLDNQNGGQIFLGSTNSFGNGAENTILINTQESGLLLDTETSLFEFVNTESQLGLSDVNNDHICQNFIEASTVSSGSCVITDLKLFTLDGRLVYDDKPNDTSSQISAGVHGVFILHLTSRGPNGESTTYEIVTL